MGTDRTQIHPQVSREENTTSANTCICKTLLSKVTHIAFKLYILSVKILTHNAPSHNASALKWLGVWLRSSTALHVLLRRLMTSSVNLTSSDSDKWSCSTGESHQNCSLDRINSLQFHTETTLLFSSTNILKSRCIYWRNKMAFDIKACLLENSWKEWNHQRGGFGERFEHHLSADARRRDSDSITGGTAPRIGTGPL